MGDDRRGRWHVGREAWVDIEAVRDYSPAEVAKLLGVDYRTVLRWIRAGELSATRLGHRTVRVGREDLERFKAERRATAAGGGATSGKGEQADG